MSQTTTETRSGSAVRVAEVRFEHVREALGIGVPEPRLSWIVQTDRVGWRQAAYEVEVRGGVRGADGSESPWSEWHPVEPGLLGPSDWSAGFITPDWDEDASRPQP